MYDQTGYDSIVTNDAGDAKDGVAVSPMYLRETQDAARDLKVVVRLQMIGARLCHFPTELLLCRFKPLGMVCTDM